MAGDRTACEEGVRDRSQCSLPPASIGYTGSLGQRVGGGGCMFSWAPSSSLQDVSDTFNTVGVNDNHGDRDTGVGGI